MIEEVQDKVISLLQTYISTELSSLASPSGGVALTLTPPQKYLLDFDPRHTILAAGDYPACIVMPAKTVLSDQLSVGVQISNEHSLALVMLLMDQDIENLQRKKSRYSQAIITVLKEHQQADPLRRIKINQVVFDRTLRDERKSAYLGSVWITFSAWERIVL